MITNLVKCIMLFMIFVGILFFYDDINTKRELFKTYSDFDIEEHSLQLKQWLQEEGDVLYSTNSTHIQDLPSSQTPVLPYPPC